MKCKQANSSSEPVETGSVVELGRSHSLIVYLTFRGDISLDQMAGQKAGMQAAPPACHRYKSAVECSGGRVQRYSCTGWGSNNFIRPHTTRLLRAPLTNLPLHNISLLLLVTFIQGLGFIFIKKDTRQRCQIPWLLCKCFKNRHQDAPWLVVHCCQLLSFVVNLRLVLPWFTLP